jgi:hypothetical protein
MTWEQWSDQIWPVLTRLASRGVRIGYADLARVIGFRGLPHWLATPLGGIAGYCRRNGLPILPVLVINKGGVPSPGIPFVKNVASETNQVFAFAWHRRPAVTPADFPRLW